MIIIITYLEKFTFNMRIQNFLNFENFFLNRELTLETLDFDFLDLLDELFHMVEKHFFEKNQIIKSYFEVSYQRYDESNLK